jgi:uncharacterized repeat protein (TIGR03803 family)
MTNVREFRGYLVYRNRAALTLTSVLAIVFALTLFASSAAHAQTFGVIYNFAGRDGGDPNAGVTIRAGNLYGTSYSGGANGVVYELTRFGSNWVYTPLSFLSAGFGPKARAVFGPNGNLYSTAGDLPPNHGVLFDVIPPLSICKTADCHWTEEVIYRFQGAGDGSMPGSGDLIWDQQGNIYGTTINGGQADFGTVYEVMHSGNQYTESVIHSFSGPDGAYPQGGIISDGKGNFFGTTVQGGLYNFGSIFELTYNPGVGWVETVIYSFQNLSDGRQPVGGLVMDASGNLYGTTQTNGSQGAGTAFELSPSGNGRTFNLLYSFAGNSNDLCGPQAPLTLDTTGNLYGTTQCSGAHGLGSIFELTNTGNGWTYTALHDFAGGTDGDYPLSNVTIDTDGSLYGTASRGGGDGVVWMIKP